MMKINKSVITAVLVLAVIVSGAVGYLGNINGFVRIAGYELVKGWKDSEQDNIFDSIKESIVEVEAMTNDKFTQKMKYIEINGIFEKTMNRNFIMDSGRKVVQLNDGSLHFYTDPVNEDSIVKNAQNLTSLYEYCDVSDIPFLFVQAPSKISKYNNTLPYMYEDNDNINANIFISYIKENNVDFIDLREEIPESNYKDKFFVTDHHWTAETAFWAYGRICEELNSRFNFGISEDKYNLDNYDITVYDDVFLGSQGKRVGKYYAGVEDISLISPKWDTNFTYTRFMSDTDDEVKNGDYENSIIFKEYLDGDLYDTNPYALYSGQDFKHCLSVNHTIDSNKRILFIRDSYGCPVTAFLANTVAELDIIDSRRYREKTMYDYIRDTKPDAVVFLCNTSTIADVEMFNFESTEPLD